MIDGQGGDRVMARNLRNTKKVYMGRRLAIAGMVSLALGYGAACLYLWVRQRQIIFRPDRITHDQPSPDQGAQRVRLPLGGEQTLVGWWFPSGKANPPTLLFLHGNRGLVADNFQTIALLQKLNFQVLAIQYRGYPPSTGPFPSEDQVYGDAQAAYDYLRNTKHIPSDRLYLYGHSLGSAIAIHLAHTNPTAGLIVEGAFTSMKAVALVTDWYRLFPLDLLLQQKLNSLAIIHQVHTPLVVIHGTADEVIPVTMGEQLYQNARSPKQLVLVPGGKHGGSPLQAPGLISQAINELMLPATRRSPHT